MRQKKYRWALKGIIQRGTLIGTPRDNSKGHEGPRGTQERAQERELIKRAHERELKRGSSREGAQERELKRESSKRELKERAQRESSRERATERELRTESFTSPYRTWLQLL